MERREDEIIQKNGKHCGHSNGNTLLPYEYEWTCISCGFNLIKRKHELAKTKRKETNFIYRLKYAKIKIFSLCVDVHKIYEGDDYDKNYEVF